MMMKMLMTKVKMKNVLEISIEFAAVVVVDYSKMIVMGVKGEIYCSYQKENVVDQ